LTISKRLVLVISFPGLFFHSQAFLIREWQRVIFRQIKEAKESCGGVVLYAAQTTPQADAEFAKKGRSQPESAHHLKPLVLTRLVLDIQKLVGNHA
jgi:hypothetical protein